MTAVESRQFFRSVSDHRDAVCFQILKRQLQIQDSFRSGTDNHHWCIRQFFQIGGDIHGHFCAAVNPADAAGGKDPDPGHMGDHHGRSDRCRSVFSSCTKNRQIAAGRFGDLGSLLSEVLNLFRGKTCFQPSADNRDRSRNRTIFPDSLFHLQSRFYILRIRHPMRNDRRLQCNDRLSVFQCLFDIFPDVQIWIQHDFIFSSDNSELIVSLPSMVIVAAFKA